MSSEISRMQEGHRLHDSVCLWHISEAHIGVCPKVWHLFLHGDMLQKGLPTLEALEASRWRIWGQFLLMVDTSVIMNDSLRAPSIHFKRGNTLSPASQLGVRTCIAIPTRPVLSISPLLTSFPGYGEPGRTVPGKSGTVLLPLSHPQGKKCLVLIQYGFLRILRLPEGYLYLQWN